MARAVIAFGLRPDEAGRLSWGDYMFLADEHLAYNGTGDEDEKLKVGRKSGKRKSDLDVVAEYEASKLNDAQ